MYTPPKEKPEDRFRVMAELMAMIPNSKVWISDDQGFVCLTGSELQHLVWMQFGVQSRYLLGLDFGHEPKYHNFFNDWQDG